jgi:hypothetical protein
MPEHVTTYRRLGTWSDRGVRQFAAQSSAIGLVSDERRALLKAQWEERLAAELADMRKSAGELSGEARIVRWKIDLALRVPA